MLTKRATIKDIAARVGVSATVVSQVLRGVQGSMVSSATRQRILDTARELGYRPNRQAQALVGGKTQTVAIWKHGLSSPFHAWVMHQCALCAYEDGYEVIIRDFASVREEAVWVHLSDVDGVLAHECPEHLRMLLQQYPQRRLPVVSMGVFYVTECDHVGIDLYPAAREAVQHLVDNGCRRIAYVAYDPDQSFGEPRYEAYRSVLQEAGISPEYIALHDAPRAEVRRLLREYFQQHGTPDGIFCHNDDTAITCLRALYDVGARVPEDVALVGCDGIQETQYTYPEISTIVQPIEQMCQLAWRLFRQRLEQPDKEIEGVVLPARFVARGSSLCC
ncbi:MAG: LacI family transcriptional regulator [Armatimonadota bacterium]|nr:MAG: LacI family transcriptional regulator [Armatimonadota bacterium]